MRPDFQVYCFRLRFTLKTFLLTFLVIKKYERRKLKFMRLPRRYAPRNDVTSIEAKQPMSEHESMKLDGNRCAVITMLNSLSS